MGKRSAVVVVSSSSSSSSEEHEGRRSSARKGGARGRSSRASRKRPRDGSSEKPGAGSCSTSASCEVGPVKFDLLSEEFCECLEDFRLGSDGKELWIDKHKPRCLAELAIHRKKVEEVRRWLDDRMKASKEQSGHCTLLITGQAGVGKSVAIHVIASHIGAELHEWTTPTPILWKEHLHYRNLGLRYMSKLDEFESFIERIRKYPLLRPVCTGEAKRPVILLIDDLPVTNSRVAFARLSKCLTTLAHSTQVPTVLVVTDFVRSDSIANSSQYREELESSLVKAGAYKVAFNPLTVNSIKKILLHICQEEKHIMPSELIDQIARSSCGDIRHAITSLQYYCLNPDRSVSITTPIVLSSSLKSEKLSSVSVTNCRLKDDLHARVPLSFGRDETLSLFHALGKFLHNKREPLDAFTTGPDTFLLKSEFARNPLKMDAPELVLSQAHGQARSIADFLHENVLDFLNEEAIDDAWLVTSYLCDADSLLGIGSHLRNSRVTCELEGVAHAFAASVAIRGVLFANSKPSHSRWHAIRSPRLWQIEQSSKRNKNQMLMDRGISYLRNVSDISIEHRSRTRWLSRKLEDSHLHGKPLPSTKEEDSFCWNGPHSSTRDIVSEESEVDEIEDW